MFFMKHMITDMIHVYTVSQNQDSKLTQLMLVMMKHMILVVVGGVVEQIMHSHVECINFKDLSINCSQTIEELMLMFYNGIQDYQEYTRIYTHNIINDRMRIHLQIFIIKQNTILIRMMVNLKIQKKKIHNDRHMRLTHYITMCIFSCMLDKFIPIKHL